LKAGWMEERQTPWWDALADALETTRATRLEWQVADRKLDLPLETQGQRARALDELLAVFRVHPDERATRLADLRARLRVLEAPHCELATWDQAASLVRAGMEIGAHTLAHPLLSQLPPEAQRREIAGSITLIERRLGVI